VVVFLSVILGVALTHKNQNHTTIVQPSSSSSSSNSDDGCPHKTNHPQQHSMPFILEETTLKGSDAFPQDEFGFSVAVDEESNIAVIGAPGDGETESGMVYIFQRSGDTWVQQHKIRSPHIGDFFGNSVAISGRTMVVGAFADDTHGVFSGSARVFVQEKESTTNQDGVGGEWVHQQVLTAHDPSEYDHFGSSVGIDGDTIVIGSYRDDHNQNVDPNIKIDEGPTVLQDGGSAYVFVRSNNSWEEKAKLVPKDNEYKDEFGRSLAIHGDTIVIGAWREGECAYVFTRSSSTGAWSEVQTLTASDANYNDAFGTSVDIHEDTIVVGAIHDDHNGHPDAGSAYVFVRSGDDNKWVEQDKLMATDSDNGDHFGISVAIHGDVAVIGASKGNMDGGLWNTGSAYVFQRNDDNDWTQVSKLQGHDTAPNDHFGAAVAMDRNTLVVGAFYLDWEGMDFESGSAYMFRVEEDCDSP